MKRNAQAVWEGSGKEGKGTLSTPSGVLKQAPYSFQSRFGDAPQTNPEELIAAAHAGCFSMALAFALGKEGFTPDKLETAADLEMVQENGGWTVKNVHLDLKAKIPGIDDAAFQKIAADAKANCPVSRVLNAEISLTATLL